MRALFDHFRLTLRLNARSPQALVYGYLVPIFFLVAFGSVFRGGVPPLWRELGQLLTISTLGGACFGLPTALVAERERGVWRRYKLLPVRMGALLASTLCARFVLVASAAVMQIVLARLMYGTPFPLHPWQLLPAFACVCFALLGLGLVIAALATNVPAVQALGQAVFLPMIMIGGVGVPLRTLPAWAQRVAGFFPGRYAVSMLQACVSEPRGLLHHGFDAVALLVIGTAAFVAGVRLFRWDALEKPNRSRFRYLTLALLAWVAVGIAAERTGRLAPVPVASTTEPTVEPWTTITPQQMDAITYTDLPDDGGTISPIAPTTEGLGGPDKERFDRIRQKLETWPPANDGTVEQRVRYLLSADAIADVTEDELEASIGREVFDQLQNDVPREDLMHVLTWIILHPADGKVKTNTPELDLQGPVAEDVVRDRVVIYAKKYLGRLLGKITD